MRKILIVNTLTDKHVSMTERKVLQEAFKVDDVVFTIVDNQIENMQYPYYEVMEFESN